MELELALLTMITRQIMANPLEGETPTARLKQVALMTVIVIEKLHVTGSPITLAKLVDITGLARNVAAQTIDPIVQRGLLVEEMGKNSMGRGTARQFQIAPVVFQSLAPFMGAPLPQSKVKAHAQ
ncbi:hypothetical protein CFBP4996_26185 (plasmid) [Agrobacterium leguminum]|uniref:hypothetical protein n=1 Tax=Agrobacterium leguminum TaxID=2792015 RepID=UPI0010C95B5C|nr:hypothetical protein [Agrobacterium leguminum]WFS69564.1 hypothetical protein CFBP4996_26185 [Agrobacterium leguminum]